jgi:hypothetical protein
LFFLSFIKSFNTVGISPTVSLSKKTIEVQNTRGDVTIREISLDTTDIDTSLASSHSQEGANLRVTGIDRFLGYFHRKSEGISSIP